MSFSIAKDSQVQALDSVTGQWHPAVIKDVDTIRNRARILFTDIQRLEQWKKIGDMTDEARQVLSEVSSTEFKELCKSAIDDSSACIPGPLKLHVASGFNSLLASLLEEFDNCGHVSTEVCRRLRHESIRLQGESFLRMMELIILRLFISATGKDLIRVPMVMRMTSRRLAPGRLPPSVCKGLRRGDRICFQDRGHREQAVVDTNDGYKCCVLTVEGLVVVYEDIFNEPEDSLHLELDATFSDVDDVAADPDWELSRFSEASDLDTPELPPPRTQPRYATIQTSSTQETPRKIPTSTPVRTKKKKGITILRAGSSIRSLGDAVTRETTAFRQSEHPCVHHVESQATNQTESVVRLAESSAVHHAESSAVHLAESSAVHHAESSAVHHAESSAVHHAKASAVHLAESSAVHLAVSPASSVSPVVTPVSPVSSLDISLLSAQVTSLKRELVEVKQNQKLMMNTQLMIVNMLKTLVPSSTSQYVPEADQTPASPNKTITDSRVWTLRPVDIPEILTDATVSTIIQQRQGGDPIIEARQNAGSRPNLAKELMSRMFTLGELHGRNVYGRSMGRDQSRKPFKKNIVDEIFSVCFQVFPTHSDTEKCKSACVTAMNTFNRYLWNKRLCAYTFPELPSNFN